MKKPYVKITVSGDTVINLPRGITLLHGENSIGLKVWKKGQKLNRFVSVRFGKKTPKSIVFEQISE